MTSRNTQEAPQDTPAGSVSSWQHTWRLAARQDDELRSSDLFVIDAHAEHYYHGKEAFRGVGVSDKRLSWYTGLSRSTVAASRARVIKRGWLKLVRAHGPGRVARYALVIPEQFAAGRPQLDLVPKVEQVTEVSEIETVTPPQLSGIQTHTPSLSPSLPTSAPGDRPDPATSSSDEAGRSSTKTKNKPKPRGKATEAQREQALELVGPVLRRHPRVLTSLDRIAVLVAACLAAGHTHRGISEALSGAETGYAPAGLIVKRLQALQDAPAPSERIAAPDYDPAERQRARDELHAATAGAAGGGLAGLRAELAALGLTDVQRQAQRVAQISKASA